MKNESVSFKLVCAVVLAGVVLAVIDPAQAVQWFKVAIKSAPAVVAAK